MSFVGLNPSEPADSAFVGDGAAEIRGLKSALTNVFPGLDNEVVKPLDYGPSPGSTQVSSADMSQLFVDVSAATNPGESNSLIIPQGMITMFFGTLNAAKITELNGIGWYVCDGTTNNGIVTPDLRDRFVKGWDGTEGSVGTVGGGASLGTLTTENTYVIGTTTPKSLTKSAAWEFTLGVQHLPEHSHTLLANHDDNTDHASPGTNLTAPYLAQAATAGSGDSEYELTGTNRVPDTFSTADAGQTTPTAIRMEVDDRSFDAASFAHEHQVVVSGDLEPNHMRLAYLCYCGVA